MKELSVKDGLRKNLAPKLNKLKGIQEKFITFFQNYKNIFSSLIKNRRYKKHTNNNRRFDHPYDQTRSLADRTRSGDSR